MSVTPIRFMDEDGWREFEEAGTSTPSVLPRRRETSGWLFVVAAVVVPASLAAGAIACALWLGSEITRRALAK